MPRQPGGVRAVRFAPSSSDYAGVWPIIDPTVGVAGVLTLPERFEPFVVRGDRVFGVERDELDISYVAVHRFVAREGD